MKDKSIAVACKFYRGELNPFDGAALECALQTGARVTVVAMAPLSVLSALQTLTRLGVRAVLLSDPIYAGSDTIATSLILSAAMKKLNPDLIFCGRQSVDGDTAQVPPMLAERLGFAIRAKVMACEEGEYRLRGGEIVRPQGKEIFTFERMCTLRFPSAFSRAGEVEVWDNGVLGLPVEKCGLQGSPTRVIKSYESNVGRRTCKFVSAEEIPALIAEGLQKVRTREKCATGEKLERAYFVGGVEEIAQGIAKRAIALSVAGKTPAEIAVELLEKDAKVVLWEDREELKLLAPQVAVLAGAGICADCISFRVEDGELIMTRPALGGNITADIVCNGRAFATVRTVHAGHSDVIFSIGKGAVRELQSIRKAAEKYGAEICCSRIVTDSGELPYAAQVGLTGKTVSPKVYVALGVSGAVQHTCAIAGAGTVIAVNPDKQARIFDYADYGIVAEVENVKL